MRFERIARLEPRSRQCEADAVGHSRSGNGEEGEDARRLREGMSEKLGWQNLRRKQIGGIFAWCVGGTSANFAEAACRWDTG